MRVKKFSSLRVGDKVQITSTGKTYVTTLKKIVIGSEPITSSVSDFRDAGFMAEGVISRIDEQYGRVYVDTPDGTMVIIWIDFVIQMVGLIRKIIVLLQETFSK